MSLFVGNISKNVDFKDLDKSFSYYGSCKINKRVGDFRREADDSINFAREATPSLNSRMRLTLKMQKKAFKARILVVYILILNGAEGPGGLTLERRGGGT